MPVIECVPFVRPFRRVELAALPNFRIDTVRTGTSITLELEGELDSDTCPQLLERFDQALAAGAAREIVLDLSRVSFVDSAGMRAIILIERAAGERELGLSIRPPTGPVIDLFEITGIGERVALAPRDDDMPREGSFVERIELELPREPGAPARARAELREAVSGRVAESDRGTLTLLTSELVTNAVIHPGEDAGGSVGLRIIVAGDRVRVEVSDAGPGFDTANLRPRPRGAGGHGLFVVDGLASRWGTKRIGAPDAKRFCVWFELDTDPEAAGEGDEAAQRQVAAAEG
jgi:anti-sigma B factor antagonist